MKKNKLLTAQELADLVGCSRRNIYSSRDRGLLVCDDKGLFDISVKVNAAFIEERKEGKVKQGRPVNVENNLSMTEVNLAKKKADAELAKMRVEYAKKKLLSTDFVEEKLITYIEKLNSNIERTAATSIKDMGKKILDAGEVNSAMITEWTNLFLTLCHNTKIQMIEEIKNFNPQENKIKI